MHIICLTPLETGVYNDNYKDNIDAPPDGWAYIPEDFSLPSTFPRLKSLKAEELTYFYEAEIEKDDKIVIEKREKLIMTVTEMTEGTLPAPTPEPKAEPTDTEILNALLGVD